MFGVSKIEVCEDVALITFPEIPCSLAVMSDIFDCFARGGVNIDMISQSSPSDEAVSLSFTCFGADVVKVLSIAKELRENHPGIKPLVNAGNWKIQLYGEEMREMHGVFAHALKSLRELKTELRLVTTSEVDISLLIDTAHASDAVSALKNTFSL